MRDQLSRHAMFSDHRQKISPYFISFIADISHLLLLLIMITVQRTSWTLIHKIIINLTQAMKRMIQILKVVIKII